MTLGLPRRFFPTFPYNPQDRFYNLSGTAGGSVAASSFSNNYSLYLSGAMNAPTGAATSTFAMTGGLAPALPLGGGFPMSFSFWSHYSGTAPNGQGNPITTPIMFSVGNSGAGVGSRQLSVSFHGRSGVWTTWEWAITDSPDSISAATARGTWPEAYKWNHFLCVYDPSGAANNDRAKVFINGNLSSTVTAFVGTIPAVSLTSSQKFCIGAQQATSRGTKAMYNNFAIYNVALTGTDAELHFGGGTPPDLRTITGSANLIHYYPELVSGSKVMTDAITSFAGVTPMNLGLNANDSAFMTGSVPPSGTAFWSSVT